MNPVAALVTIVVVGLVLLVGSCSSISIVDTGHRGVKTVFGKVSGEPLAEGIYFNSPFTTHINSIDIRTQRVDGESVTYTKDVQTANIKYVVNYSVEGTHAGELYRTVGRDYAQKLIMPNAEGALKSTIGKWEAVDLIGSREKVRGEVELFLKTQLAPRGISIEGFQITNIDYSDDFEHAVEAKVVAIQSAEQAKNQTVQIQEQATQRVISAKAEAESMRIRAESLSQNRALVDWEAVQKWDGVLPQYMMGNTVPFININKVQ